MMKRNHLISGLVFSILGCQQPGVGLLELSSLESWNGAQTNNPEMTIIHATGKNSQCPEFSILSQNNPETGPTMVIGMLEDKLMWWNKPHINEKETFYLHNNSGDWSCVIGVTLTVYEQEDFVPDKASPNQH